MGQTDFARDAASISRRGAAAGYDGAAQWRWLRACTGSSMSLCCRCWNSQWKWLLSFAIRLPLIAEQVIEVL